MTVMISRGEQKNYAATTVNGNRLLLLPKGYPWYNIMFPLFRFDDVFIPIAVAGARCQTLIRFANNINKLINKRKAEGKKKRENVNTKYYELRFWSAASHANALCAQMFRNPDQFVLCCNKMRNVSGLEIWTREHRICTSLKQFPLLERSLLNVYAMPCNDRNY
jgi:hypothetical protein